MWGSELEHVTEGLPEERKALALRYTIDAAEAQRREQSAAQAAAAEGQDARTPGGTGRTASPRSVSPAVTVVPAARRPERGSSLKARLGKVLNHRHEGAVAEVRVGQRASELQSGHLRCARCGRECSREENWTLRLCGDDQLHPVCRGCDERDFSDATGLGDSLRLRPLAE